MKKHSKERKTSLFVLLGLLITGISTSITLNLYKYNIEKKILSQNTQYAKDSSQENSLQVLSRLNEAENVIELSAIHFSELLKSSSYSDYYSLLEEINKIDYFDRIVYITPDGTNHSLEGHADVSDRAYFINGMNGKTGIEWLSKSRITGNSSIIFYTPIKDEDNVIGVLAGHYQTDKLRGILKNELFEQEINTLLITIDGDPIEFSGNPEGYDKIDNFIDYAETFKFTNKKDYADFKTFFSDNTEQKVSYNIKGSKGVTIMTLCKLENEDMIIVQFYPPTITESMANETIYLATTYTLILVGLFVFLFLVIIVMDHSQKKRMKYAIQEATAEERRANIAKTEFLSRMSHDIRTPINGILGMLEIIKKNREDEEKVDDCLNKIDNSSRFLLLLINDVLDMSKLESGKMEFIEEPFEMKELLESCYEICLTQSSERSINLLPLNTNNIKHNYLLGSQLHFRQIILNILSNAVKYNKPNGSIIMKVDELNCIDNLATFKIVISDTGIGMSEEFQKTIFDAFTQENPTARTVFKGSGLGMSIVKKMVDGMNGEITLESKKDIGSTFTLTMSFKLNPTPVVKKEAEYIDDSYLKGMRVLLVEDNELNMEIAKYMLEDVGIIVEEAHDGKQAVDMFTKSTPKYYDAILMDVMMPVMDGLVATRTIRGINRIDSKFIPIIAMTANAFAEDVKKCKDAGMNEHIAKPLDLAKLMSTLKKYSRH